MPGRDAQLLDEAVRGAGALALDYFRSGVSARDKKDGTPVTDADLAVDDFLNTPLGTARPEYGWLSEETADDPARLAKKRLWIIDPVDGTRAFVERTGQWSISAALVENGKPVIARIFRPLAGVMYAAEPGKGARANGVGIKVSGRTGLAGARLIARKRVFARHRWDKPWPPVETGLVTSLALRLCLVADGSYDGALALGDKCEWDLAAGDLILSEAGGKLCDAKGENFTYNRPAACRGGGIVAGTPDVQCAMADMMKHLKR